MLDMRGQISKIVDRKMDERLLKGVFKALEEDPEKKALAESVKDADETSLPVEAVFAVLSDSATNEDDLESQEEDDGQLEFHEFAILFDLIGLEIDMDMQQRMFAFADRDNSGFIDVDEFD